MSLRLTVSILMLMTALALGSIAYRLSAPPTVQAADLNPAPLPTPAPGYLIAAHALQPGTFLRDADLSAAAAPPDHLPAQSIANAPENRAALQGALVRHFIAGGAVITQADLVRPGDHGFLAAVLEPGMRAVSVAVDVVTGVSGLIWPGDRVDLLLTQQLDQKLVPLAERVSSEVVLHDVRVIAVDQNLVRDTSPAALADSRIARTITLQVTTDQAERVAIAQQLGRLSVAIRAAEPAATKAATAQTLFSGDVSPALWRRTGPMGAKVQVIEGGKSTAYTFP